MLSLLRFSGGLLLVLLCSATVGFPVQAQPDLPREAPRGLRQFDTDLSNATVDLSELKAGGPSKDGIPSIDDPSFVSVDEASDWIDLKEPVIVVERNGIVRAYPLQILIYHEIVNDEIGDTPVAVTFCPLCYSSITFPRTIDGESVTFGVSGRGGRFV